MPQTRREVGARVQDIDRATQHVRALFVHKPADAAEDVEMQKRRKKRYCVKGRAVRGQVYWDVFDLTKFPPAFVAGGFFWLEEAIAHSRDLLLGRTVVSFAGVRGMFRKPGRDGLARPVRRLDLPGQGEVSVKHLLDGSVLVG